MVTVCVSVCVSPRKGACTALASWIRSHMGLQGHSQNRNQEECEILKQKWKNTVTRQKETSKIREGGPLRGNSSY